MSSPVRDIEVNVVSSPESSSRNGSPEPENFRIINHLSQPNITCFPVIKTTSDDEKNDNKDLSKVQQKNSGSSTNFSISSILSRTEPAVKKNGFFATGQNVLDASVANSTDSAMLSR